MCGKQSSPGKWIDRRAQGQSEARTNRIGKEQMKSKKEVCVVPEFKWEDEAWGLNMDSQLLKILLDKSAPKKFTCPYLPLPSYVSQPVHIPHPHPPSSKQPSHPPQATFSARARIPLISPEGLCREEESKDIKFSANFGRVLRKKGDGWRVIKLPPISQCLFGEVSGFW